MENKKTDLTLAIFMVGIFILVIGVAGFFVYRQYVSHSPQGQSQNGNGQQDQTAGWNVLKNDQLGFTMKYPSNFFDVGHDPKILVGDCNDSVFPNSCPDIKNTVAQDQDANGMYANNTMVNVSKLTLNNTPYCSSYISDAATGHLYSHYYYATVKNQKCLVVYLVTSATNCDFYLPLEQGNTEQAKNYNDCITKTNEQPKILQQIINTFTFTTTP